MADKEQKPEFSAEGIADPSTGKRLRVLSERAREIYLAEVNRNERILSELKHILEEETLIYQELGESVDLDLLIQCEGRVKSGLLKYSQVSQDFLDYLTRIGTADSLREVPARRLVRESVISKADVLLDHKTITQLRAPGFQSELQSVEPSSAALNTGTSTSRPKQAGSTCSRQSKHGSKASSSSSYSLILKQRSKAEGAKAKLQFAEREAELQKKLFLLAAQKEVAIAEAELGAVIEDVDEHASQVSDLSEIKRERTLNFVKAESPSLHFSDRHDSRGPQLSHTQVPPPGGTLIPQPHQAPDHRQDHTPVPHQGHTAEPLIDHTSGPQTGHQPTHPQGHSAIRFDLSDGLQSLQPTRPPPGHPADTCTFAGPSTEPVPEHYITSEPYSATGLSPVHTQRQLSNYSMKSSPDLPCVSSSLLLNPHATPYQHRYADTTPPAVHNYGQDVNNNIEKPLADMTKFLLKKDLILSRISKYDDNPSLYLTWKLTFQNIMQELSATPVEELDMLIRHLGNESSKQACIIRRCNADDPTTALKLVWERLEERFGAPELIESSLRRQIAQFPKINNHDVKKLYDLVDLADEIASVKRQPRYASLFGYFDSPTGINPLVIKLPTALQDRWTTAATKFKRRETSVYPPFTFFVSFLKDIAKMKNDPSFNYNFDNEKSSGNHSRNSRTSAVVSARKTETVPSVTHDSSETSDSPRCPVHHTRHSLNECNSFRSRPIKDRKQFIMTQGLCFKCCGPTKHRAKQCTNHVKCCVCGGSHPGALHEESRHQEKKGMVTHEGEKRTEKVSSSCTQICGAPGGTSKSCAKIIPVKIFHKDSKQHSRTVYALIDDQSNHSLASPSFFDAFGQNSPDYQYTLVSCSGSITMSGRRASGFQIESLDGECCFALPNLIECTELPNNREEIPSRRVAENFYHLADIKDRIPDLMEDVQIEILIGRDLIDAHIVQDQRKGASGMPYAQKLPLGWVIIGMVCLNALHLPNKITVNKTHILDNGRPSILQPCENKLLVKNNIFAKTEQDEKPAHSIEDTIFLDLMDENFRRNSDGYWEAPLPFRPRRQSLPNNRPQALNRALSLDRGLSRNPVKKGHVSAFMDKIFQKGHAEEAPPIPDTTERWYLPMFGVYHPQKKDSIRMVFDSSAKFNSTSLNEALLKGPDITNNLQGILLRFRRERVAVTGDVEQMFHNFKVRIDHRDYLRFLWHPENNLDLPLKEYRMTVHVFGNRPSPAVATYGLRRSVAHSDSDVIDFVTRDFYVDDGLLSCPTEDAAVDLMQRTQFALKEGGQLRLHKIASNSKSVLSKFPVDDLAKDLKDFDVGENDLPIQRSLGLSWDINIDAFTFKISSERKPFTRRGVLSTINSLFDPLGFGSPVTVQGKLLLRQMLSTPHKVDWDDPLDGSFCQRWSSWIESIHYLENINIPRMCCKFSLIEASHREVHIFTDASKDAIAAVAFLKVWKDSEKSDIGFLMGKAKVAPTHGHTIPRLELCAAVLGIEIAEIIKEQLNFEQRDFWFYSDSQVILGYITNEARRFYVYVANRVSRIRTFSKPDHWQHVATDQNPADLGTRAFSAQGLSESMWLRGPAFLREDNLPTDFKIPHKNSAILSLEDKEVRPVVDVNKVDIDRKPIGPLISRVERYSQWSKLVRSIALLRHVVQSLRNPCEYSHRRWHQCPRSLDLDSLKAAETVLLKGTQREAFKEEINALQQGKPIPRSSSITTLAPFLDSDGLLRVGGRIAAAKKFVDLEVHPLIVPKKSHIATLLVRHCHESVYHQGCRITEGKIRSSGFWIIGAKRLIGSTIHHCVTCRRLRGSFCSQKMADLPEDRLTPGPPFSFVGVDTFGPWEVTARRTRGGLATSKRWAIMFTCLVSRGIHIELVEELSTSSFINALRRFVSIRGPVRQFRSDRGTNFVGAVNELQMIHQFVEKPQAQRFLLDKESTWIFNPPHASHFGGVWERMIGVARRILDSMLLRTGSRSLTHETLSTFMAEVCAIVNSRPLHQCPKILVNLWPFHLQ